VHELADQNKRLFEENRKLADQIRARPAAPVDPGVVPAQTAAAPTPTPPSPSPPAASEDLPPPAVASPVSDDSASVTAVPTMPMAAAPVLNVPPAFSALLESGGGPIDPGADAGQGREFLAGRYDKGFVLVEPTDEQRTPFALKFNLTTQVRYTAFARAARTWTDSSGLVLPILQQSNFELNRSWFTFSGFAFSPRLRFNTSVFTSSTRNVTVAMGAISYVFGKALTLSGGYFKVPGTREWIESNRYTLGADRTMANTFFRPSVSPGVWITGEPLKGLYYYNGIFNDFNTAALGTDRRNNHMTYAANVWWEPLGAFGPGYSDEEYHEDLAVRTGSSFTFHRSLREPNLQAGLTNPENTILRLSDGTPLFQPSALAPGVTLSAASVALFSYDLAFKYRGFSLSGEYYARWIYDLDSRGGPVPRADRTIFDTGGFAQFAYAVIPRRFELFARSSYVTGPFGSGSEWGGGTNWYVFADRNVRGTFEVKKINHSPASNSLYGYFAGESGTLFQLQLLTDF